MSKDPIKFGTDGWRALIADTYTFENLARVSHATVQWLKKTNPSKGSVVIGYDTRFLGREFAEHSARIFGSLGIKVILSDSFTPTPAVSWATRERNCGAGIVITASHNPPEYSGYKIKADFGGPATPEMTTAVEAEIERLGTIPEFKTLDQLRNEKMLVEIPLTSLYTDLIKDRIDVDAIRASGIKVAHDAMYGAGQGIIVALLGEKNVVAMRHDHNPGFHGQAPEPIERNLTELPKAIVKNGCAAGIANDGDADRVGMYDEKGTYVSAHEILCLLAKYLHEERGYTGDIVKTFSTTHMLDRIGERFGLNVVTMPIGFKHIGPKIVEGDVLVGGEESGGISVKGHIPERDGVFIGMLILEMMVKRNRKLSELVDELHEQFGPHRTFRIDVRTTPEAKESILTQLGSGGGLKSIGGKKVTRVDTLDGYKHITDDGWLLIRPSGTEPVLRVYSEAKTEREARKLVTDAAEALGISVPV